MGSNRDTIDQQLLGADPDGEGLWTLGQPTVVVAGAVAHPPATSIEGQARHNCKIKDINDRTVAGRLADRECPPWPLRWRLDRSEDHDGLVDHVWIGHDQPAGQQWVDQPINVDLPRHGCIQSDALDPLTCCDQLKKVWLDAVGQLVAFGVGHRRTQAACVLPQEHLLVVADGGERLLVRHG